MGYIGKDMNQKLANTFTSGDKFLPLSPKLVSDC